MVDIFCVKDQKQLVIIDVRAELLHKLVAKCMRIPLKYTIFIEYGNISTGY